MIRVWESKDVRSTVDGSLSQLQGSEVPIGSYFLGSKTVAARDGSQKTADLELSLLGKSVSENQVLLVEIDGKQVAPYKVIMREQSMLGSANVLLERHV